MSTTITTDFLCELADTFQAILAQLHEGNIDPAAELASDTIEKLTTYLPTRSVEDLGVAWHNKLRGMFCRVEGEDYLGIILSIYAAKHEVRVLAVSDSPHDYISDWDLVYPLLDEEAAWPPEGLLADSVTEPAFALDVQEPQAADEDEDEEPEPEPEPEPGTTEPGWPISREEFGLLPNKSTVAVVCPDGGILSARRTRKNRWLLDEAGGTICDAEAWDELLGSSTDEVVYCTHEAR